MSNNSIGFGANNGILKPLLDLGFLTHTNLNQNAPVGSVDDFDVIAFNQVKTACQQFEANLGSIVVNGVATVVANQSIAQISDLSTLVTTSPTAAFTSIPDASQSTIQYTAKVGIMALKIAATANGAIGSLLFSAWAPVLANSQYELYIKYFSSVVGGNIGIKFDMTGLTPLPGDTAVAYKVFGLQEVTVDNINPIVEITSDGLITIQGIDTAVSEVIAGVNTTVYGVRMAS